MKIYEDVQAFQQLGKSVVTLGTFDGVHIGHQRLLQELRAQAQETESKAVVVTFWPHPRHVIAQKCSFHVRLLNTFEEKVALLAQQGVDQLLKIPFTQTFAQLEAKNFIQQVLVAQIGASRVIVGRAHHFGKDRKGNVTLLQEEGLKHGFTVTQVSSASINNSPISSTKIRQLLLAGQVREAAAHLGKPYAIECSVLQNHATHKGGLCITATSPHKLIPAAGHYTVQVVYQKTAYQGTLHITHKHTAPTMALKLLHAPRAVGQGHSLSIQFKQKCPKDPQPRQQN